MTPNLLSVFSQLNRIIIWIDHYPSACKFNGHFSDMLDLLSFYKLLSSGVNKPIGNCYALKHSRQELVFRLTYILKYLQWNRKMLPLCSLSYSETNSNSSIFQADSSFMHGDSFFSFVSQSLSYPLFLCRYLAPSRFTIHPDRHRFSKNETFLSLLSIC